MWFVCAHQPRQMLDLLCTLPSAEYGPAHCLKSLRKLNSRANASKWSPTKHIQIFGRDCLDTALHPFQPGRGTLHAPHPQGLAYPEL